MREEISRHADREPRRTEQSGLAHFEDAAAGWLDERQAVAGIKGTTLADYRSMLRPQDHTPRPRGRDPRARLMRAFGGRNVEDISEADVRRFMRELDADPTIGPRTTNKHRLVLSGIFGYARDQGWIDSNPVDAVPKRREPDQRELIVYSPQQVHAIARRAKSEVDAALIITLAFTGLRLGEALELRWRDVRFPEQTIHVQRSYTAGAGVSTPMGRRGRSVPLPNQVAEALARLGQRDKFTGPNDLVFANGVGQHQDRTSLRRRYCEARDGAASDDPTMPILRLHDLRHTFGSLCASGGIDVVAIQAMMGHESLRTTQRYLHHRSAADAAGRLQRYSMADHRLRPRLVILP